MTAPRRRLSAARLITAPILFVVAVGVATQSIAALAFFAHNADMRDLAASIENGVSPNRDYLLRFVTDNGLDQTASSCGDTFTRARLTVSLAALQSVAKGDDFALIDAAEANALEIVKERLRCNPLDGNAWLQYAASRVQSSGPALTASVW